MRSWHNSPISRLQSSKFSLFTRLTGALALTTNDRSAFKKVWDQLLKGLRAFIDMKSIETEAHGKELEFHKNIYKKFVLFHNIVLELSLTNSTYSRTRKCCMLSKASSQNVTKSKASWKVFSLSYLSDEQADMLIMQASNSLCCKSKSK